MEQNCHKVGPSVGFKPQLDSASVNQYLTNSSQERMGDLGDKPIVFKNEQGIRLNFKSQQFERIRKRDREKEMHLNELSIVIESGCPQNHDIGKFQLILQHEKNKKHCRQVLLVLKRGNLSHK